jgi:isoleucyl-tRNA synthetase
MSRSLAPVIPFLTEQIYQNLIRSVYPDAHQSIHHTLWPEVDQNAIDQKLINQMKLARETASQGLSARSNVGIKVRQPLAQVLVHVKEGQAELDEELIEIVQDELNVKDLSFVQDAKSLLAYKVLPDNRALGPKYGADFPKVQAALSEQDPDEIVNLVNEGKNIPLELEGKQILLTAEEILIRTEAAEGLSTVDSKLLTVAIDTEITAELRAEGFAREIVRRIQDFRKKADFDISDRISLVYQASPLLKDAIQAHQDYIKEETLSLEMREGAPEKGMYSGTSSFEGEEVTLGLKVIE